MNGSENKRGGLLRWAIPDFATGIGDYAFRSCGSLNSETKRLPAARFGDGIF